MSLLYEIIHKIRQIPFILHYRLNKYIKKNQHYLPNLYALRGEVNKELAHPGSLVEITDWFYQRNIRYMKKRLDVVLIPDQIFWHDMKHILPWYIDYNDLECRIARYMQREFKINGDVPK